MVDKDIKDVKHCLECIKIQLTNPQPHNVENAIQLADSALRFLGPSDPPKMVSRFTCSLGFLDNTKELLADETGQIYIVTTSGHRRIDDTHSLEWCRRAVATGSWFEEKL
jgi:hypothetical protein